MNTKQLKKQLILNIPYIILGLLATNLGAVSYTHLTLPTIRLV